jgi:CheY-like chemotaxis protein
VARVLVVDDDLPILTLVSSMLRRRGHQVVTADSPEAALRLLDEKGAPDILVSDVAMPGMSGLEMVERIRAREGLEHLPVVFLSARVEAADIAAGRALGATYLTKPFIANALLGAIDRMLQPSLEGTW